MSTALFHEMHIVLVVTTRMTRRSTSSIHRKPASVFPTPGTDRSSTSTKSRRKVDVKGSKPSPELESADETTVPNSGNDNFDNMLFPTRDTHSRFPEPKKLEKKGLEEANDELGIYQAPGITGDLFHQEMAIIHHSYISSYVLQES